MRPARLICLFTACFLWACSRPPTNVQTGLRDQVLHFGNGAEPKSIDPHVGTSVGANNIISALMEGLMAEHPETLEPVPGVVVTMPDISPDGCVYTFTFRENAKWSNGDSVKPSDFEFSWHRMLNPELGARYAEFLYDIKNARRYNLGRMCEGGLWLLGNEQVEIAAHAEQWAKLSEPQKKAAWPMLKPPKDSKAKPTCPFCKKELAVPTWNDWSIAQVGVTAHDANRTLVVELENPNPLFLEKLNHYSYWPVHPATIDQFDARIRKDTKWTQPGGYVGNGPFMLTEWRINARLVAERNPHYWDRTRVKLNAVHFYPIDSKDTEERAARAGFLHSTQSLPSHRLENLTKYWPNHYRAEKYLGVYFYRFNVTEPPMDDIRVRRAFSMSVDRAKLVKYVLRGGQQPAFGLVPPGTGKFAAVPRYPYDPARAKKLLKAYLAEKGDAGRKLINNIELKYNKSEDHQKIAEAIQAMWQENLGVEVKLLNEEWKVFMTTVEELDYQISRMGWIGDFRDPMTFLDLWVTGGGNNNTGWSHTKFDDLIGQARRESDLEKRFGIYNQCEDILAAEMPVLSIYFYRKHYMLHPTVKGWHPTVLDHHPLKHVYLEATD